jgi:NAD(P)-dependent dehydrogenase (short-subunit alcohol dehydrogenase family)
MGSPSARNRQTVLVTGGNSGIGFECARRLARERYPVIIASRDREASRAAVARLQADTGNDAITDMELDLGSCAAVRRFAEEIAARDVPLHAVVCNAGLQTSGALVRTPDGVERTFAVNHLGHFLLVNLLLGRLLAHAPARIVVVASGVHDPKLRTGMPKPNVGHLDVLATTGGATPGAFDGRLAYVNSKLCNVWFTYELGRRLVAAGLVGKDRPLSVNAFDPGLVPGSGLAREYPAALRMIWFRVLPAVARIATRFVPTINTADKAGAALAGLVIDSPLEHISGKYFPSHARWGEAASSEASYDRARAAALWEASVRLTSLRADESPLVAAG